MGNEKNLDNNKTQIYSDTRKNKTQKYSDLSIAQRGTEAYNKNDTSMMKTVGYGLDKSIQLNRTKTHNLGTDDTIVLKNVEYTVIGVISEENTTGEAVIYKIRGNNDHIFALKLYYSFRDSKEEPNSESLERIMKINDPDILKLYDYGTGEHKYQDRFCYEICDFAKGGNLLSVNNIKEKYTSEFLMSNVIPEIYKGIKRLHRNKIFHCDLKPENVFYLDEKQTDLIIGDYGSAKTFDIDFANAFKYTITVKGSPLFKAPELFEFVISEKSDYYSFGIILLNLLYHELFKGSENDLEIFHHIRSRRFAGQKIIDFNPDYHRINTLIEGLTLHQHHNRWGELEVEKWLNGEYVEVLYPARTDITPIKLGKVTIRTENDLIEFIESNINWSEDLIQDETGYKLLLEWVTHLQDLSRKKVFDRMIRYYQQDGEAFFKEAILRYFNSQRAITIDMKTYTFFCEENFNDLVTTFFNQIDDIWKFTSIEKIRFYIFQLEFCLRQLLEVSQPELKLQITAVLEKISSVLNIAPKEYFSDYRAVFYPNIDDKKLLELFYAFNKQRVFKDNENNPYKTIDEIGFLLAKKKELFDDKYTLIEKNLFFKKNNRKDLIELTYIDTLIEIFADKVKTNIEFIDLIESQSQNSKIMYKLHKSLTEFFSSKGFDDIFLKKSPQIYEFDYENDDDIGWFKFFIFLKSKYNIQDKDFISENKKEFRSKLLLGHEKIYFDSQVIKIIEKYKKREKSLEHEIKFIRNSDKYHYYNNNYWNYLWGAIAIIVSFFISRS
jgi:serine/threonine protein kinase